MNEKKVNTKACHSAIRKMTNADARYIRLCLDFRFELERLMRDYGKTEKDIVRRFGISPRKAKDFICGAFDYSVTDLAVLEVYSRELFDTKHNSVTLK